MCEYGKVASKQCVSMGRPGDYVSQLCMSLGRPGDEGLGTWRAEKQGQAEREVIAFRWSQHA